MYTSSVLAVLPEVHLVYCSKYTYTVLRVYSSISECHFTLDLASDTDLKFYATFIFFCFINGTNNVIIIFISNI